MTYYWTTGSLRTIEEMFPASDEEIAEVLGRTPQSVKHQRLKMGLRHRRSKTKWQPGEVEVLKAKHGTCDARVIADLVGRTVRSVQAKAYELNLDSIERHWSAEEEQWLKDHYQEVSDEEIAAKLGRTTVAVTNKRHRMKLHRGPGNRWTPEEDEVLKKLYRIRSTRELAVQLGRTPTSVYARAQRLRDRGEMK